MTKKNAAALLLCYILWGFQPLYWKLLGSLDSMTILALRIVFAALFSSLLLLCQGRLREVKTVFGTKQLMKLMAPAAIFLLADWTVFILVVNSGHILDASIGYYINPLLIFLAGVVIYKEKCGRLQIFALVLAAAGVAVSAFAFGSVPYVSLVIAVNWAIYAVIKKNVQLDGILSIAVETLMMTVPAIVFLLFFRRQELAAISGRLWPYLVGSGIVTALPMFLYSRCVSKLPLVLMCFAQYLSPTFNLICGFITGESLTHSQLVSFVFFAAAIVVYTVNEIKTYKERSDGNEI